MIQLTFAMLKPHIVKNPIVVERILSTVEEKFKILKMKELQMDSNIAGTFYQEHLGKFYYDRLLQLMTSGPAIALVLEGENGIEKWRESMGPTKIYKGVFTHPNTLRSLYGLSDTRNVCHGADSPISVKREISIIFPDFMYDDYMNNLKKCNN